MRLGGVLLPVTTPFEGATGEPDERAFRRNLRAWLEHPVAGVVVAGSTGEAPLLDDDEALRLVEWAREEAADRTVVAGTGLESTRATARLSAAAAERGADAVLVRPPAYYVDAMSPAALVAHYTAVADASPVPLILYNIPRYVPVELVPELVGQLLRHGNIAGVKDSSGDMRVLGALAAACEGRGALLVGSGALLYGGLELGAKGGILAVGCMAPGPACEIHSAWVEGEPARAGRLQERVGPLHKRVVGRHGVPGVKHALDLLGLHGGPPRPPLLPLSGSGRREVEEAVAAAGLAPLGVEAAVTETDAGA